MAIYLGRSVGQTNWMMQQLGVALSKGRRVCIATNNPHLTLMQLWRHLPRYWFVVTENGVIADGKWQRPLRPYRTG